MPFIHQREYILFMVVHADFAVQPTESDWNTVIADLYLNQNSWSFLHDLLAGTDAALAEKWKLSQGAGEEFRWAVVRFDIRSDLFPEIKAHFGTTTISNTVTQVLTDLQDELQQSAQDALGLSAAQAAKITIPVNAGSVINDNADWTALKATVRTYLDNNAANWYA